MRGAAIAAWLGDPGTGTRRRLHSVGRVLSRRPRRLTFFHRVDDPHSHLLALLLAERVALWPVEVELVVVPEPAAAVDPEPKLRETWALRDAGMLAAAYRQAFPEAPGVPEPSRVRAANASLLLERPWAEQLAAAVRLGRALFDGDGAALHEATRELGAVPGQQVGPMLERNYARLRSAGHYQAGMIHYGGEWYWGADRLVHLEQRLRDELKQLPESQAPTHPPAPELQRDADGKLPIELFHSLRSPYSYLGLVRLAALEAAGGVRLTVRPVLPMVTRGLAVPKTKVLYIVKDAAREAERLGIDFGHICDPLGDGVARVLAVHQLAERHGRGTDFLLRVGRAVWAEARDLTRDDTLQALATDVGLDGADALAALEDEMWRDVARVNRDALYELGLWGVPSIAVGALGLWGQDRVDWVEGWIRGGGA